MPTIHPQLIDLMTSTVTVHRRAGTDKFGQETWLMRGQYRCYKTATSKAVRNKEGQAVTPNLTLYVAADSLDVTDKYVVNDKPYWAVNVETYYDEVGSVYAQVVNLIQATA